MKMHALHRQHYALSDRAAKIQLKFMPDQYFDVWIDANNDECPFALMMRGTIVAMGTYQVIDTILSNVESNPEFREQLKHHKAG